MDLFDETELPFNLTVEQSADGWSEQARRDKQRERQAAFDRAQPDLFEETGNGQRT